MNKQNSLRLEEGIATQLLENHSPRIFLSFLGNTTQTNLIFLTQDKQDILFKTQKVLEIRCEGPQKGPRGIQNVLDLHKCQLSDVSPWVPVPLLSFLPHQPECKRVMNTAFLDGDHSVVLTISQWLGQPSQVTWLNLSSEKLLPCPASLTGLQHSWCEQNNKDDIWTVATVSQCVPVIQIQELWH